MKPQILNELDAAAIRQGSLRKIFPELYEVKGVIENIPSMHRQHNVFDHLLETFEAMNELLQLRFLEKKEKEKMQRLLQQEVDGVAKRQLLLFTALVHDIGKKETIRHENGRDYCPGHDKAGEEKLRRILPRLGFTAAQIRFLVTMVGQHLTVIDAAKAAGEGKLLQQDVLKRAAASPYPEELTLHGYADMLGGHSRKLNPPLFAAMEKSFRDVLTALLK